MCSGYVEDENIKRASQMTNMGNLNIWLSASSEWPILLLYGIVSNNGTIYGEFPHYFPYLGEWGRRIDDSEPIIANAGLLTIQILWYSIRENRFFQYKKDLTIESPKSSELLIGLYRDGEIAIWEYDDFQSRFLGYDIGIDKSEDIFSLIAFDSNILKLLDPEESSFKSLQSHYHDFLSSNYDFSDVTELPLSKLSESYMYKIIFNILYDDLELDVDRLHITFWDGSFFNDFKQELFLYTKKALPKYIKLSCNVGKHEYEILIRLQINEMYSLVRKFNGTHPDTKAEIIVKFNVEYNDCKLALYRQGLKEPVVIPESAYQLIVFKNKFEDYRSENYNQPRGAWIW